MVSECMDIWHRMSIIMATGSTVTAPGMTSTSLAGSRTPKAGGLKIYPAGGRQISGLK